MTHDSAKADSSNRTDGAPSFVEHHVPRDEGKLYARDYKGAGPAFVLMHGFPDNLHIWDDLVPYLTASGRRVVTFDFLGFGASDKPAGATYSFRQQMGILQRSSMNWAWERLSRSPTILLGSRPSTTLSRTPTVSTPSSCSTQPTPKTPQSFGPR
jgi:pimeloyl-ACP methyl ester carboxylesterase